MSEYYIKAILLDNCSYSSAARDLLTHHKIANEIVNITSRDMNIYSTNDISTYPQLYLKKHNTNGNLLIGGYEDLKNSIDMFKGMKLSDENINKFMNKHKWSRKATLRFIQVINKVAQTF
jgi:glutaredoxin